MAMVNYIDQTLKVYKSMADEADDELEKRRYQVIYDMYISEDKKTVKEISEIQFCTERTVYKLVNGACETLSVLMFGVDGVRFIK